MFSLYKKQRNIFLKVFIPILLILLTLEIVFAFFFYFLSARNLKEQLTTRCLSVATAVSELIAQDIPNYKKFVATLDTSSDYYRQIKTSLEKIYYTARGGIIYLDVSIRHSDDLLMYIFDGIHEDDPLFAPPGSLDNLSQAGKKAFQTQEVFLADFHTNKSTEWGNLLSAYVPIRDASGDFLGMATVQISMRKYQEIMNGLYVFTLCSLVLTGIVIALVLGYSLGYFQYSLSVDPLTSLPNRALLLKELKQQQKRSKRTGSPAVVFMADLDHFKSINDTYGHPFGDVVLRHVGTVLSAALRKSDNIARYGGEEFAGCISNLDEVTASEIFCRMRKAIANSPVYNHELQKEVPITISIGYAALQANLDPLEALNNADKALYEAKKLRNSVVGYGQLASADSSS